MYNTELLFEKFRHTIKEYEMLPAGAKALVGFSGGADSVALLHLLMRFLGRERLVAFHLNHMLRGAESERDEAFCRRFCKENGVRFVSRRVDIPSLGEGGTEEKARAVRYSLFEEMAKEEGCVAIALAHHADDNLETMLFHLARGAGLRGISGIPPKRALGDITVIRPLIDATRAEILGYLEKNALEYVTDSTNSDTEYTRNLIRHKMLPLLYQINPRAAENARNTAAVAARAAEHLKNEAESLLSAGERDAIETNTFASLSPSLRHEVLTLLYQNAGGTSLSAERERAVTRLVFEKKKGAKIELPENITAFIDGGKLVITGRNGGETTPCGGDLSQKEGICPLSEGVFVLFDPHFDDFEALKECEIVFRAEAKLKKECLATLRLRPRENGESYRFGGMTRSLKKLLSGADRRTKSRPLFADENGIVWHPNFPAADRARDEEGILVVYIETR